MKKIVILDSDNNVVMAVSDNGTDPTIEALAAGLLSSPLVLEVPTSSPATIGWKYIDGEVVENAN